MALSANTNLVYRNNLGYKRDAETVKTGKTVYQGALLSLVGAGTSCEPSTDDAGTGTFLGVAYGYAQATETATYEYDMEVRIPFKTGHIAATHRGVPAFCYDDEKVTVRATLGPRCGVVCDYITSYVWVWIRGPAMQDVADVVVPIPF